MRVHTASLSRHRSHVLVLAALHLTLLVGITDSLAAASPPTSAPALEAAAEALPLDPPTLQPATVLLDPALTPMYEHQTFVAGGTAHLAPDRVLTSVLREITPQEVRRVSSSTMLHAARTGEIALVPPERYGDHAPTGAATRPRHHRQILDFHGWTHAGPGERLPGR